MSSVDARFSLADLAGAGICLPPAEAAAIVREIAQRVVCGDLPGVPSGHVLRFTDTGQIVVEGPVTADGPDVSRAAHLLETLLPDADAPPRLRASGALRLVVARALGTLDLPPYESLAAFTRALERFAVSDIAAAIRERHASWSASREAGTAAAAGRKQDAAREPTSTTADDAAESELTVSDIRRARRETRLTLSEVSERSRIPAWLLRELEWGYFRHWPAGVYGRTQLVRYARAAGLDDRLVVRTVWPELEAEARRRGSTAIVLGDLQPANPEQGSGAAMQVPPERGAIEPAAPAAVPAVHRHRLAAALSIAALLAVALIPATWQQLHDRPVPPKGPALDTPAAVSAPAAPVEAAPRPTVVEPTPATETGAAVVDDDAEQGVVPARHLDEMTLRITRVADDGARNNHERVSPDGRRIAFDSDREGPRSVYVADIDGRNVRRVSGDGFAALPSWSLDSRTLLFARAEPDHPDVWNLWSVDVETGERRRLTSYETGRPWGASWFPDGRRIAFTREAALVVLDVESGEAHEFRSPLGGRPMRSPAVSPDGRHVIVQVLRDGAWLVGVPDGSMRRVVDDPTADAFSWAPDGRRVAYHSSRFGGWSVWVRVGA